MIHINNFITSNTVLHILYLLYSCWFIIFIIIVYLWHVAWNKSHTYFFNKFHIQPSSHGAWIFKMCM